MFWTQCCGYLEVYTRMFQFQIPTRPPDVIFVEIDQQMMSGGPFWNPESKIGTSLKIIPILSFSRMFHWNSFSPFHWRFSPRIGTIFFRLHETFVSTLGQIGVIVNEIAFDFLAVLGQNWEKIAKLSKQLERRESLFPFLASRRPFWTSFDEKGRRGSPKKN